MSRLERIKARITRRSNNERVELRTWFDEFDAEMRDRQIEDDAKNGRLDSAADAAQCKAN